MACLVQLEDMDFSFHQSSDEYSPSAEPSGSKVDMPFAEQYPLRILIVEDDYISRRVLIILLERLGYDVDAVENGLECLECAGKNHYDLILTDIDMPRMDGLECANCLRQSGIDSQIIAVTANCEHSRKHCLKAGINGYIVKPLSPHELMHNLRETYLSKKAKSSTQATRLRS
jgi:CheY-like chemotaxis protein